MSAPSPKQITELLLNWSNGNQDALDELIPLVHAELRRLARRYMRREKSGHTLQTSALVNEAYMRLIDYKNVRWQNRAQFFGIAAQSMRRILVDHARAHRYRKRGGGAEKVSLDEEAIVCEERAGELAALDDALTSLAKIDPRRSQIVELRFFGGLNAEETAEVLGISPRTIGREWRVAKVWLYRELRK